MPKMNKRQEQYRDMAAANAIMWFMAAALVAAVTLTGKL